jgi:hypothetical protein
MGSAKSGNRKTIGKRIPMRIVRTLLVFLALAIPASLFGQISIRIAIGPPMLPVYEQPICPGDGYLWTPGYWAYDDSISDYYWVPGTWVMAPEEGYLWTPGYWGWGDGGYLFYDGYWGPTVGFYGGINYGYGYWGGGYEGGRWNNGHFFYNSSVNNLSGGNFHNVYNERVKNNNESRVSFNGGRGGIGTRPTSDQEAAVNQRHIPAVAAQTQHVQAARGNPEQRAGVNHGNPAIAATAKPGDFSQQHGTIGARSTATETHATVHPKDLPQIARPAAVNSGNAKADKKYEQKQDQLITKQTQDRQQLQQKQDAEHQRTPNTNTQQLEQKHQQQTQNLAQKHTSQQQSLQTRQPQARPSSGQPQARPSGGGGRK